MLNMQMPLAEQVSKKILLVAPAWIGDMVMANTLAQVLKQQNSENVIDVLAPASTAPLASRMAEIRQVTIVPAGHKELKLKARYLVAKQLSCEHYAQAIVLPNTIKSALIPWLARIPQRTGWLGEKRYRLLNDIYYEPQRLPRLVQRYAALALPAIKSRKDATVPLWPENFEQLPNPSLAVDTVNQQHLQQQFALSTRQPILALCPGAEFGSAKRWPVEYFAKLAQLTLSMGWQVVILGGAKDIQLGAEINRQARYCCIDLTSKTSLLDAIDLLGLAHAVVSNDSGLMHISAALQKPLIAIYGSSSPNYTPPLDKKSKILYLGIRCSPCFKRECPLVGDANLRCLLDITPEKVAGALRDFLP
jgi:heptosyltransferase II